VSGADIRSGDTPPSRPAWILPVLVVSVFSGASLWFAGNAILEPLTRSWQLPDDALARVTTAVQLGFIAGTLVFAFLSIPDRFPPGRVYLLSSTAAAAANISLLALDGNYLALLICRFCTGFFLAGIYPVGMKIAAGWYARDLGRPIGYLLAALILGSAFPHLIASMGREISWMLVTVVVSLMAFVGGLALYRWVPDGPFLTQAAQFDPKAIGRIFQSAKFRASAFGYFGHMWELYAFWAFLPVFLGAHLTMTDVDNFDLSRWTFFIIAVGVFGAAGGGVLSRKTGSAPVAAGQLAVSGACCLLSPLAFYLPTPLFLIFLLIWGLTVAGDSPQFSALNAATAPREYVGSALTIANCIGFSITIVSIELVNRLTQWVPAAAIFVILALGPVIGIRCVWPLVLRDPSGGSR